MKSFHLKMLRNVVKRTYLMTYQRFVSWEKENSKSSDNPTDFKCFERIAICDFEKMKRNRSSPPLTL